MRSPCDFWRTDKHHEHTTVAECLAFVLDSCFQQPKLEPPYGRTESNKSSQVLFCSHCFGSGCKRFLSWPTGKKGRRNISRLSLSERILRPGLYSSGGVYSSYKDSAELGEVRQVLLAGFEPEAAPREGEDFVFKARAGRMNAMNECLQCTSSSCSCECFLFCPGGVERASCGPGKPRPLTGVLHCSAAGLAVRIRRNQISGRASNAAPRVRCSSKCRAQLACAISEEQLHELKEQCERGELKKTTFLEKRQP